jgi:CRISPR-associated endonuclease Cas1
MHMNAKWLAHLLTYRESEHRLLAIQKMLYHKIASQAGLLQRYGKHIDIPANITEIENPKKLLLAEARYARVYWKSFALLLPIWCSWQGRIPHAPDRVNKLLDIGYHTLASIVQKKCDTLDIPTEIGLLHTAQSAHAHPLVYDIMECFRVLMVDKVLLKFLRMKKRPLEVVDQVCIRDFLHEVYRVLHNEYYHRGRHACISVSYWMDLVLLEFRNAVSKQRAFSPVWMPVRHENRCNRKPPYNAEV